MLGLAQDSTTVLLRAFELPGRHRPRPAGGVRDHGLRKRWGVARSEPMINLEDNALLLRCCCHGKDHIAFLIYEPDDSRGNNLKGEDDNWYLSVLLDPITPWWKRVWRALFPRNRLGSYAELVLTNEDARRIAEFVGKRLDGRGAPTTA
jgi:hypothetical protein